MLDRGLLLVHASILISRAGGEQAGVMVRGAWNDQGLNLAKNLGRAENRKPNSLHCCTHGENECVTRSVAGLAMHTTTTIV